MMTIDGFLTMMNGFVVIQSGVTAAILLHYLFYVRRQGIYHLRKSSLCTVIILLLGIWINRSAVWAWYMFDKNHTFDDPEVIFILIGVMLMAASMLVMVYLATRDRLGPWPAVLMVVMSTIYILITLTTPLGRIGI
jgi:hypothetical protein